ncbi:toll-like receptor 8 [Xenopus laevis]|uniref:TIR domain-containing protein n=2 Tax=Xenopus laevis TaxID=8355 RepID=A0A974DPL4_XENLA|nr:toll-like receptor 8 [Xenopus laevis]OCT95200.1 hypothetical protein XELAEV_18012885mg [Xenopus laevis]
MAGLPQTLLLVLLITCSSLKCADKKPNNRTIPCRITENGFSASFDCRARWLQMVPHPIKYTSDSVELLLSQNLIQTINNESFHDWHNLTKIDLNWNHYPKSKLDNADICKRGLEIENGTFSYLSKLEELFIDHNLLCKIPQGIPSTVQTLSFSYNNIFSVSKQILSPLINLKILFLSHNCYFGNDCDQVLDIEEGTFAGLAELTVLSLSFNNLTCVPSKLPASLKELYLSNNNIQTINENDFQNLVNLEVLFLSGNCPRCFNANYPCKNQCKLISINIHPFAFQNLKNLTKLHLGSTSLRTIPPIWFQNTTQLKILNLERNYLIKEIASADFLLHLPFLEVLDLSFNYDLRSYANHINISDHFSKLLSLRELHIQGYVFKDIAAQNLAPLKNLSKLKILNLGINFIRQVDFDVFQKITGLQLIYLSENRITPFSEKNNKIKLFGDHNYSVSSPGFTFPTQSNFQLTNTFNQLVKPQCSSHGKTLDLSLNSIFFIDPEEFRSFSDIACLNLSSNGIGQDLNGTEFIYLKKLVYLDLSFNKLDFDSLNAFQELPALEVLDLSYNSHYFLVDGVTHRLKFIENLQYLKVLNLSWNKISTLTDFQLLSHSLKELQFSGNRLDVLWMKGDKRYHKLFKNLYNLTSLDISHNRLHKISEEKLNNLPLSLTKLYLNNNELVYFGWKALKAYKNLKHLDLSHNKLTMVMANLSIYTYSLSTLILSYNSISNLPVAFLHRAGNLTELSLSFNHLKSINSSVLLSGSENYLKVLRLKGNPFDCTCEMIDFIRWIYANNVTIPRLATDVTCATPENRKGSGIIYFDVHTCDLDRASMILFFLSLLLVINVMVLSVLKNVFYWDLWYVYHVCVSKLRWYKVCKSDCLYDVFIAYDNKDPEVSDWIFNELCHHLENRGDKHMHLCLEERDWEPGKAIIDNLAHSINRSKKTLFVLTRKYVKSGKFKTAFYLALQKLMDENMDVIVIVLLEPVLQNSQYLRLRRKICKSSIMEWPKNPKAKGLFWQRMKNMLMTENCMRYNTFYTDPIAN